MIDSIATCKKLEVSSTSEKLSILYPYSEEDTIGDQIVKIRQNNNISQIDLAKMLGYKFAGCLANIENGDKYPSPQAIVKLYNYFGAIVCVDDYSKFITSDFSSMVKTYRERNNLTQRELGKKLNICANTVRRLERGELIKKYKYDDIKSTLNTII